MIPTLLTKFIQIIFITTDLMPQKVRKEEIDIWNLIFDDRIRV